MKLLIDVGLESYQAFHRWKDADSLTTSLII